jgi:DNA-binding MarR family transcriptional regulator
MNVTQLAVMRAILRRPNEPLSRVAEDLAMDRTSLYRALGALQKQRWVALGAGRDSRSRCATITRRGTLALAEADPGWSGTQTQIVDRFGRAEWQALVRELQRLVDCASHVDALESTPGRHP